MKKIITLLLSTLSVSVLAQNNNFKMNVSANISSGCMVSIPNLNFGDLTTSYSASVDYKETRFYTQISVLCSKGTSYELKGQHAPVLDYATEHNLTYRAWFLPIYHSSNPREDEFVAYRLAFTDINGKLVKFGDGVANAYPSPNLTKVITSKGTGKTQVTDFTVRVWTYRMLTPGNYSGYYTVTLNY